MQVSRVWRTLLQDTDDPEVLVAYVRRYLGYGPTTPLDLEPDSSDDSFATVAHVAVRVATPVIVSALLDAFPELMVVPDSMGNTPLHLAAADMPDVLLHVAQTKGQTVSMTHCLGFKNTSRQSVLHVMCDHGHTQHVRALLPFIPVRMITRDYSSLQRPPLALAFITDNLELAHLLLAHIAKADQNQYQTLDPDADLDVEQELPTSASPCSHLGIPGLDEYDAWQLVRACVTDDVWPDIIPWPDTLVQDACAMMPYTNKTFWSLALHNVIINPSKPREQTLLYRIIHAARGMSAHMQSWWDLDLEWVELLLSRVDQGFVLHIHQGDERGHTLLCHVSSHDKHPRAMACIDACLRHGAHDEEVWFSVWSPEILHKLLSHFTTGVHLTDDSNMTPLDNVLNERHSGMARAWVDADRELQLGLDMNRWCQWTPPPVLHPTLPDDLVPYVQSRTRNMRAILAYYVIRAPQDDEGNDEDEESEPEVSVSRLETVLRAWMDGEDAGSGSSPGLAQELAQDVDPEPDTPVSPWLLHMDAGHNTLLHLAAQASESTLNMLLRLTDTHPMPSEALSAVNVCGYTPLVHTLVYADHEDRVQRVLSDVYGASMDELEALAQSQLPSRDATVLHLLCRAGRLHMFASLLARYPDPMHPQLETRDGKARLCVHVCPAELRSHFMIVIMCYAQRIVPTTPQECPICLQSCASLIPPNVVTQPCACRPARRAMCLVCTTRILLGNLRCPMCREDLEPNVQTEPVHIGGLSIGLGANSQEGDEEDY